MLDVSIALPEGQRGTFPSPSPQARQPLNSTSFGDESVKEYNSDQELQPQVHSASAGQSSVEQQNGIGIFSPITPNFSSTEFNPPQSFSNVHFDASTSQQPPPQSPYTSFSTPYRPGTSTTNTTSSTEPATSQGVQDRAYLDRLAEQYRSNTSSTSRFNQTAATPQTSTPAGMGLASSSLGSFSFNQQQQQQQQHQQVQQKPLTTPVQPPSHYQPQQFHHQQPHPQPGSGSGEQSNGRGMSSSVLSGYSIRRK